MKAKEFNVINWIDIDGKKIKPIHLSDYKGKFKLIFCFQSWCPGCHSTGFPKLQKIVKALENKDNIAFLAIQTVFEGFESNTITEIVKMQKKYALKIPFGHDAGQDNKSNSLFMEKYQTGGTPWFILIDKNDEIIFSDFHISVDNQALAYLKDLE